MINAASPEATQTIRDELLNTRIIVTGGRRDSKKEDQEAADLEGEEGEDYE